MAWIIGQMEKAPRKGDPVLVVLVGEDVPHIARFSAGSWSGMRSDEEDIVFACHDEAIRCWQPIEPPPAEGAGARKQEAKRC